MATDWLIQFALHCIECYGWKIWRIKGDSMRFFGWLRSPFVLLTLNLCAGNLDPRCPTVRRQWVTTVRQRRAATPRPSTTWLCYSETGRQQPHRLTTQWPPYCSKPPSPASSRWVTASQTDHSVASLLQQATQSGLIQVSDSLADWPLGGLPTAASRPVRPHPGEWQPRRLTTRWPPYCSKPPSPASSRWVTASQTDHSVASLLQQATQSGLIQVSDSLADWPLGGLPTAASRPVRPHPGEWQPHRLTTRWPPYCSKPPSPASSRWVTASQTDHSVASLLQQATQSGLIQVSDSLTDWPLGGLPTAASHPVRPHPGEWQPHRLTTRWPPYCSKPPSLASSRWVTASQTDHSVASLLQQATQSGLIQVSDSLTDWPLGGLPTAASHPVWPHPGEWQPHRLTTRWPPYCSKPPSPASSRWVTASQTDHSVASLLQQATQSGLIQVSDSLTDWPLGGLPTAASHPVWPRPGEWQPHRLTTRWPPYCSKPPSPASSRWVTASQTDHSVASLLQQAAQSGLVQVSDSLTDWPLGGLPTAASRPVRPRPGEWQPHRLTTRWPPYCSKPPSPASSRWVTASQTDHSVASLLQQATQSGLIQVSDSLTDWPLGGLPTAASRPVRPHPGEWQPHRLTTRWPPYCSKPPSPASSRWVTASQTDHSVASLLQQATQSGLIQVSDSLADWPLGGLPTAASHPVWPHPGEWQPHRLTTRWPPYCSKPPSLASSRWVTASQTDHSVASLLQQATQSGLIQVSDSLADWPLGGLPTAASRPVRPRPGECRVISIKRLEIYVVELFLLYWDSSRCWFA